jgi:hypothetical protein
LDIIVALEKKKGFKIHGELVAAGYSDEKVFGEWKVKAYLILATGLSARGNIEEALATLKLARATITDFPSSVVLQRTEREVLKLSATLKERRKAQVSKERRRAKAMFAATNDDTTTTTTTTTISVGNEAVGGSKPNAAKSNSSHGNQNNKTRQTTRSTTTGSSVYQEWWFQSPLVLSGLGIVAAGVAGAFLVYNQALRKQRV